ncbi:ANTAR domain-containing protein [Nocardia alni]|uniref:ANTAR domain-containing protein n=1 Tax=Nocardia alni TaxID=2815723 RepID=UPI001C24E90D|nr:ANTAR domain-containing protein [Nocardia alni]
MNAAVTRFLTMLHELDATANARPVQGDRLCAVCVRVLPVSQAAITLAMPDGGWEVLGTHGEAAARFADAQSATGEGPGPDAHAEGAAIRVLDFTAATATGRWPLLTQWDRVDVSGALCSIPLHLGAIRLGFLDLLGADLVTRDTGAYNDASQIASAITTMLLTTLTAPAHGSAEIDGAALGPWWEHPVGAREIHQATGMIAVQLDCTAAAAYSRLVGYAFTTERTLAEIAGDVVARRLRFRPYHEPDTQRDTGSGPIR